MSRTIEQNGVKVVYDMPFDDYKSVEALSSSALKQISVSISDYIEVQEKDSKALELGRAIHDAVLFGRDYFTEKYSKPFQKTEDMLDSKDDLTTFCDKNGIPYKPTWAKEKIENAIENAGFKVIFYKKAKTDYENGKTVLSEYDRVLRILEHIKNSKAWDVLEDMEKEVAVFWSDKNGIPCKARFDAVSDNIFELKTFDNFMNYSLDELAVKTICKMRYDMQAVFYDEAFAACREAKIEGFGNKMPDIYFLFAQTKGGYNYLCETFKKLDPLHGDYTAYWQIAEQDIESAKMLYKKHIMEKQPVDYNFTFRELCTNDFPVYHLQRLRGELSYVA